MLLKAGVDISRLDRNIRRILTRLDNLALEHDTELVITSTYEGTHSAGSLHYGNLAIDIRPFTSSMSRYVIETMSEDCKEILAKVGKDYDVIPERDHIHIEYDPKR